MKKSYLYILTLLCCTYTACTTPDSASAICDDCDTPTNSATGCVDTNCADYSSQEAAQRAFDANPVCRNDLDRDNDGIACESFSYKQAPVSYNCATTANCGCAGKRKVVCQQNPCCKWVKGKGCRCN